MTKINIYTNRKSHLPQRARPDLSKKTNHNSNLSSSDYMTRKSNFNIKKKKFTWFFRFVFYMKHKMGTM